MKAGTPVGVILAVVFMVQLTAGCSTRDMEKAFYIGAKITYDSMKGSKQPVRP